MRRRRARRRRETLVVAEPGKVAVVHAKEGQIAFVSPGGLVQVYREDEPDREEDVLLKVVRLLMGRDPARREETVATDESLAHLS